VIEHNRFFFYFKVTTIHKDIFYLIIQNSVSWPVSIQHSLTDIGEITKSCSYSCFIRSIEQNSCQLTDLDQSGLSSTVKANKIGGTNYI